MGIRRIARGILALAVLAVPQGAGAERNQASLDEVAKQLNNPIGSVWNFRLQIKPVIPAMVKNPIF